MKHKHVPSAGPSITDTEVKLVTEAIKHGWYENRNMHIDQFISEFKSYTGMKYCLPTCNCTSALHLAMLALDIGAGDEVIVPDITWVASATPVLYVGAKPVFADIDKYDWCLSPGSLEKAITEKTKAIIVVDILGNIAQMDEIISIAKKHQIPIIEDAAEGIGATYQGQKAGTFGKIGVYSFNATKLMIAGQGGALVTDDEEIYRKCKLFVHHGIDQAREGKYYWSYKIGYNYQWTNIQAALALGQLRRIDELVKIKRRIGGWYKENLSNIEGIRFNFERSGVSNTFWIVTVIISPEYGITKERIIEKAQEYQIDIRPFFYPLSSMPSFKAYCSDKDMERANPVSYSISPYGICLPSAMSLEKDDVDYVCGCFKEIFRSQFYNLVSKIGNTL